VREYESVREWMGFGGMRGCGWEDRTGGRHDK